MALTNNRKNKTLCSSTNNFHHVITTQYNYLEQKHSKISSCYEVEGVGTTLKAIEEDENDDYITNNNNNHLSSSSNNFSNNDNIDNNNPSNKNGNNNNINNNNNFNNSNNGNHNNSSIHKKIPLKERHRFWMDLDQLDDCNTRFTLIEKKLKKSENEKNKQNQELKTLEYRFRLYGKVNVNNDNSSINVNNIKKSENNKKKKNKTIILDKNRIELPYDLPLSEHLSFIRKNTKNSNNNTVLEINNNSINNNNNTINRLFDQIVIMDNKLYKDRLPQIEINETPQNITLNSSNNLLNDYKNDITTTTINSNILKIKLSNNNLFKNNNIYKDPRYYTFKIKLINFSNSNYQIKKSKFNLNITQLKSINSKNSNYQTITINNLTLNNNYFLNINEEDINNNTNLEIFYLPIILPWIGEDNCELLLNQYFNLILNSNNGNIKLLNCIISFNKLDKLIIVNNELIKKYVYITNNSVNNNNLLLDDNYSILNIVMNEKKNKIITNMDHLNNYLKKRNILLHPSHSKIKKFNQWNSIPNYILDNAKQQLKVVHSSIENNLSFSK
ncbi:hypothetical protein ABK040_004970 [Willaertia magna]